MMIVVFGDKEHVIDDAKLLIEARVRTRARNHCRIVTLKSRDESHSLFAEPSEDVLDRVAVMIGFVRFAICQVGRREPLASNFEIVQPFQPKVFQIEQMPSLFLNRPLSASRPVNTSRDNPCVNSSSRDGVPRTRSMTVANISIGRSKENVRLNHSVREIN